MHQSPPQTLLEKIWRAHAIHERADGATLLHIDRHFIHDGMGPPFAQMRERGLEVRLPKRSIAMADHYVATKPGLLVSPDPKIRAIIRDFEDDARKSGMTLFDQKDTRRGIVHVVGPEQGITQPGMIIVCGDSHTATHGALGSLAFGIGASEVGHVLATHTIWQNKPKTMRVTVSGMLQNGVSAKDLVLAVISKIGAAGGTGHVIEYAGSAVTSLSIEGRLTVCNMSIEAGARAGMIGPDDKTFAYLAGRPFAPSGREWDDAIAYWRSFPSDPEAVFDREVSIDGGSIPPMVTWGTSPETASPIDSLVPDPANEPDAARRENMSKALQYMGLTPGTPLTSVCVDRVFIGSCTNSRIEDLRAAAKVIAGRRAVVPAQVVPGSSAVKAQAEAEGLADVFRAAGFEWHEPGCSLCVGMNGDQVQPGQRCASTSNRNFVGRQGKGARTHLVSPAMAAAAAVNGRFVDVRQQPGA